MKKVTRIITVCIVAMLLTACVGKETGGTVTPKPTEESQTQSQGTKDTTPNTVTPEITSTEVSLDALLNHSETPAEDFDYRADGTYSYIYGYLGTDPMVVIPETLDGCPVRNVGGLGESGIQAIKFSDSVEEIEKNCFLTGGALEEETMEKLKIVVMGENVKLIDDNAFMGCGNLETILLNGTLEKIGDMAFNGTSAKEIRVPESVTEIEGAAFSMHGTQNIYVKSGSYAESWCKEWKENFRDFTYVVE